MLSFLSPLFLAGAAAAAIPIVLHLLRREPEARVRFAAVKFLKEAPVEHTDKHRLRELLLLALRITALILLAVAFARPFFRAAALTAPGGTTIIALDTSYSLSAPGQFERARQLAKAAVSRAPGGDRVGVVTFADDAEIVARPGGDRVLATAAIDRATVGFGSTRYRSALSASTQALDGKRGTIVVITDLQENGWDAGDRVSVPEGTTIEVADVGAVAANLAVTAVRPQADRIVATVHNGGAGARDARLHLTIDGRPAGEATTSLGPNQSVDVLFARAPRGSVASVAVDDPDGIQADNVRYAVLGGTMKPSVLVVTGSGDLSRDGFYAQQALAAGRSAYDVAGIGGAQLSIAGSDVIGSRAAVLLLSTRGLERHGREALASYVRAGGGLIVAAGPDIDGDVVGDVLGAESTLRVASPPDARPEPRTLAPADVRHPVFEAFSGNATSLGLVKFQHAARISGSACQILARFTTGDAALIECASGDGRALVIASDLDNRWNDFPLHSTFVPFLHEAVGYVASARAHASEYFIADAPAGVKKAPGFATVVDAGRGTARRRVAINVDPRESELVRLSPEDFQSAVTRLKDDATAETRIEARQQEDRQHLWQFLVVAMALTLAVEGFVAARTA
jgi:aerotolerance regulator-like protein/VWA domain-containing protein